jgi:hypothetical protein
MNVLRRFAHCAHGALSSSNGVAEEEIRRTRAVTRMRKSSTLLLARLVRADLAPVAFRPTARSGDGYVERTVTTNDGIRLAVTDYRSDRDDAPTADDFVATTAEKTLSAA